MNRNRNKVDKVTQRHYIHYKFWQLLDSDEEKSDLLCFSLRMLRRGVCGQTWCPAGGCLPGHKINKEAMSGRGCGDVMCCDM